MAPLKLDESALIRQVARYGLPLVILIYYFTASGGIEYTPDSVYVSLDHAKDLAGGLNISAGSDGHGLPNPLWIAMVAAGLLTQLNGVLAAKVLSVLFCSLAVLTTYLIAVELLEDRLFGFCVALAMAMQGWLLQVGPSGSGLGLGLVLSLASMFFLLRNEYLLASLFAALGTLVFWQAAMLLPLILLDLHLRAREPTHARRLSARSLLTFVVLLVPWAGYAGLHGIRILPVLATFGDPLVHAWWGIAALGVVMLPVIGGGIAVARSADRGAFLLGHAAPLLWIAWLALTGGFGQREMWYMAFPLLSVYAFFGLREVVSTGRDSRMVYPAALLAAGIFLLVNQISFNVVTKPFMRESVAESEDLVAIAYWLRSSTQPDATVGSERPGVVGFYSDRAVASLSGSGGGDPAFIVSAREAVPGYTRVYDPARLASPGRPGAAVRFSVWKRI